jgi:hypothetical protein
MADLISATGHVAVFTGLDSDGNTTYHYRPLLAWTVNDEGRLVGQYLNGQGRTAVASNVPNFHRYMTDDEWAIFSLAQYRLPRSIESETS